MAKYEIYEGNKLLGVYEGKNPFEAYCEMIFLSGFGDVIHTGGQSLEMSYFYSKLKFKSVGDPFDKKNKD